jgi:molybdopterin synthase catalytic subunit
MKVRAQFFAQLRDITGKSEIDIDLGEDAKVGDLLDRIYREFPSLRAHDKSILVGTGVEFVDRNYVLSADEEIAIMPPVQGG